MDSEFDLIAKLKNCSIQDDSFNVPVSALASKHCQRHGWVIIVEKEPIRNIWENLEEFENRHCLWFVQVSTAVNQLRNEICKTRKALVSHNFSISEDGLGHVRVDLVCQMIPLTEEFLKEQEEKEKNPIFPPRINERILPKRKVLYVLKTTGDPIIKWEQL